MSDDSYYQAHFAGEFRHAIDSKNRITIPAAWREKEPQNFILVPDAKSQYLAVMSRAEFARMSAKAEADGNFPPHARRTFSRHFHARAEHGLSDKQGRLVLPEAACKKLGLKGEVMLVGGEGRFEIWNLQKWKQAHEADTETYEDIAKAIGL